MRHMKKYTLIQSNYTQALVPQLSKKFYELKIYIIIIITLAIGSISSSPISVAQLRSDNLLTNPSENGTLFLRTSETRIQSNYFNPD